MSDDRQKEVEGGVMKIYSGSSPNVDDLYERAYINQLAWTLLVLALGMIVWLFIALSNAENQRYAMSTKQCADPVFKGDFDAKCMATVHSRPHWWQHVGYALTHLTPD
jgi:hypothetical protein